MLTLVKVLREEFLFLYKKALKKIYIIYVLKLLYLKKVKTLLLLVKKNYYNKKEV